MQQVKIRILKTVAGNAAFAALPMVPGHQGCLWAVNHRAVSIKKLRQRLAASYQISTWEKPLGTGLKTFGGVEGRLSGSAQGCVVRFVFRDDDQPRWMEIVVKSAGCDTDVRAALSFRQKIDNQRL